MAVSLDQINGLVTKTLNWLRDRMVPTGTIICGLYTAPPAGYLAFKRTDRILKTQYPALCALLFKINGFKGDGSTYAQIPDVDHRVLEMCSNISEVGQLMEAGLPNITGSAAWEKNGYGDLTHCLEGCFTLEPSGTGNASNDGSHRGKGSAKVIIDASKCSQLYSGSTLQPSTIRGLAIIKI